MAKNGSGSVTNYKTGRQRPAREDAAGGTGGGGEGATDYKSLDIDQENALGDKFFNKLSSSQRSALNDYTGSGYYEMNQVLRKGETPSAYKQETINSLTSALNQPVGVNLRTYRGYNSGELHELAEKAKNGNLKGALIEDKGFMSTSLKPSVSQGFASGGSSQVFMNLSIKASAKGAILGKMGASNNYEREVLMQRGAKVRVTGSRFVTSPFGAKQLIIDGIIE